MSKLYLLLFLFVSLISMRCNVAIAQTHPLRYFTQAADVAGSITSYGNNNAAGKYVQSGDAKIYYETYGSGDPIFVFHGGGVGSPYELGQIIDELRKKHRTIVVSSRGHGHSEIGHNPISLEQKAADMLTVMKKETDKPAPVLGFSDGAYTAYMLAKMHPEAVERLVAIGAGTLKPGFFPSSMSIDQLEKADPAYLAQMRSLMPEPERLQKFLNDYMAFWSKTAIGADLLAKITSPVLLIGGDRDSHAPPATMLEADKLIPNSKLCIVPNAGHTAFLDNFPVTWTAIDQFLAK